MKKALGPVEIMTRTTVWTGVGLPLVIMGSGVQTVDAHGYVTMTAPQEDYKVASETPREFAKIPMATPALNGVL